MRGDPVESDTKDRNCLLSQQATHARGRIDLSRAANPRGRDAYGARGGVSFRVPLPTSARVEGYAVVSENGMLAGANGIMPDVFKIEADQRFFECGLDGVDVLIAIPESVTPIRANAIASFYEACRPGVARSSQ